MRLSALTLLGCSLLAPAIGSADSKKPNIILIVTDDQGYPDLGCMGLKPILTPTLDRLASEGVRATNFYVTWPACTPSRGSILTGRYPQRNGLYDMVRNDMTNYGHQYTPEEYAVSPEMTLGLDPREITIGNILKSAGYATGVVGKWDMGQAKRFLPLQRGFDFFYGHGNNGIDYYTHERYGVPSMFRGNNRTEDDKGTYATDVFRREALAFIEQNSARPFFLYLAFNAPHGASSFGKPGVQAPPAYLAMYEDSPIPTKVRPYAAAVTCMDAAVGDILAALKKDGRDKNTVVLFLSDNGGSGNGGNAPLKGAKSTMWEGGLRVPFIAWWPGHIPQGKTSDAFLTSLELFPTFAAIADADLPRVALDGFDMLPVLRGEVPSRRSEMFWQRRGDRAARVGHWKWLDSAKGKGLYDLSSDPGENNDLSAEKPDVASMMREKFDAWRKAMDAAEPRGPFRDY